MAAEGDMERSVLEFGRDILHDEARALDALADSLGGEFERAVELIREVRDGTPAGLPDWTCERCGEAVPGGFDLCWNCGSERASSLNPA